MGLIEEIILNVVLLGICVFLFNLIAGNSKKFIKIPKFLRWILFPFFGLFVMSLATGALRSALYLFALLLPIEDIPGNIYFYSNIVEPILVSYSFIWGCVIMTPKFKLEVAYSFGALCVILYMVIISVYFVFPNTALETYGSMKHFGLEASMFWNIVFYLMSIVGVYLAIIHLKSASGFFRNDSY